MYGVAPEERWQEQIEDYCAIHYPDPLPFADWCPLFREDFGFVYDALKKSDEQRRAVAKASDDLRGLVLRGNQISGAPRHRRDVVAVTASVRWRD